MRTTADLLPVLHLVPEPRTGWGASAQASQGRKV